MYVTKEDFRRQMIEAEFACYTKLILAYAEALPDGPVWMKAPPNPEWEKLSSGPDPDWDYADNELRRAEE